MKINGEKINPIGFVLGVTAYQLTHFPMIIVREIRKEIREQKEKKEAIKGIKLMKQYLDELHASGKITDEKYTNIMITVMREYNKLYE